jgi:hypothetical protein
MVRRVREDFMKAVFFVAAMAVGALAGPAFAATIVYKADLTSASEVPPNNSGAKGQIEASYDTASKKLTWKGTYSGLTGPETMAHFHGPAGVGVNAPPAVTVDAKAASFEGSATLTDSQAADLAGGKWYFNVHTDQNKGGEIRGQLAPGK